MRALPISIHRARGSFRADRHGGRPEPKPAIPKPPAGMDKAARALWRYYAPRLAELRVLSALDRETLAIYVRAVARLNKAEAAILETGEIIRTPAGFASPSPWIGIAQKCIETIRFYGGALGLTPESRSKIRVEPAQAPALASRFRAPWKK